MSLKKIDAKLRTFTTNRDKLRNLGHEIAMMIFDHAKEHGDTSRGLVLAKAMPKSWKVQLQNWFEQFSPIRVVEKNDKHGLLPAYKKLSPEEKEAAWKREEAAATPFYLLEEPDPEVKEFNLEAMLKFVQNTVKRIEKQVKEGNVPDTDIPTAQALLEQMKGIKVEKVVPANDPNNVDLFPAVAAAS